MRHTFKWAAIVLYTVFVLVLATRSSAEPAVLGRYSLRYSLLLLACLFYFFPFYFVLHRICYPRETAGRYCFGIWLRSAAYAGLLISILLPLEIYMRLEFDQLLEDRRIEAFHPALQAAPLRNDASLGTNAEGFRGHEIVTPKPEGVYRIFVMGGSTVFSKEIPDAKTHVRILETMLKTRYPHRKIEVFNAGYDWYTSQHSLINYLIKIKDFDPDMVIFWHGINDFARAFSPEDFSTGEYRRDYSHFLGPVSRIVLSYFRPKPFLEINLLSVDYFLRTLESYWFWKHADRLEPGPVEAVASLEAFGRNMTSLVRNLADDGVQAVVATQPYLYGENLTEAEKESIWEVKVMSRQGGKYPDLASMDRGMRQFNAITREMAGTYQVPLADLEVKVPKTGEYFWDGCHYTEQGHALIGRELFETLVRGGWLEGGV